jgi:hypothetical protein
MRAPSYDSYDAALDQLAASDIVLKNGNSNHAPMVAEALCALGRPEAVAPWLDRYRPRLQPRPPARERIPADRWREALGRRDRFADWALFFAAEIETADWRAVLERWLERLGPGFCAAATHGVIRVGHAARGLAECETQSRRRELADALAGGPATWQTLPASEARPDRAMPPAEAIGQVPLLPAEQRRPGNITTGLAALADFPEFAAVAGLLDTERAAAPLIGELCELFARVYLANARNIPTTIAFIHGLTSHAALGHIAGEVGAEALRPALCYAWQAGCALYACYGEAAPSAATTSAGDADELVEAALANGDEHVIKFTEACLCRDRAAASPAYLAAAAHAIAMLQPRRQA